MERVMVTFALIYILLTIWLIYMVLRLVKFAICGCILHYAHALHVAQVLMIMPLRRCLLAMTYFMSPVC